MRFENAIVTHVPQTRWKNDDGALGAPPACGSSIAWLLFHMTYHQDLALNTAVRNHDPLLAEHRAALGLSGFAPGAGLSESEDRDVTAALNLTELRSYATTVAATTAAWIADVPMMAFDTIPASSYRLEHIAGIPADGPWKWLHAMWNDKPVAWFVQWECVGHGHTHVGEMTSIRNRMGLSPF